MKLLVTGATGQLGSLVVKHLLTKVPAEQVAVSVRNPQKAAHLKDAGWMYAVEILLSQTP